MWQADQVSTDLAIHSQKDFLKGMEIKVWISWAMMQEDKTVSKIYRLAW